MDDAIKKVGGWWLPKTDVWVSRFLVNQGKVKANTHRKKLLRENPMDDAGRICPQYQKYKRCMQWRHRLGHERHWLRMLDVGAFVGWFTVYGVKDFQKIECFEPYAESRIAWEANMNGSNISFPDKVEMHPVACGRKNGKINLHVDSEMLHNNYVTDRKAHRKVLIRTLDSYKFPGVGFIKIDVEGSELDVIKGAVQTIQRDKPMIMVEQKGRKYRQAEDDVNAASKFLTQTLGMECLEVLSGDAIFAYR